MEMLIEWVTHAHLRFATPDFRKMPAFQFAVVGTYSAIPYVHSIAVQSDHQVSRIIHLVPGFSRSLAT